MPNYSEPWDGRESVLDALTRCGFREIFDLAIRDGLREQAVDLLVAVGVNVVKANLIIDGALPTSESDAPAAHADGDRPTANGPRPL
jgi:hypothetical protein